MQGHESNVFNFHWKDLFKWTQYKRKNQNLPRIKKVTCMLKKPMWSRLILKNAKHMVSNKQWNDLYFYILQCQCSGTHLTGSTAPKVNVGASHRGLKNVWCRNDAGTLKGAKKEKPSRAKSNPQLTQNQVSVCAIEYDNPSRPSWFSNSCLWQETS